MRHRHRNHGKRLASMAVQNRFQLQLAAAFTEWANSATAVRQAEQLQWQLNLQQQDVETRMRDAASAHVARLAAAYFVRSSRAKGAVTLNAWHRVAAAATMEAARDAAADAGRQKEMLRDRWLAAAQAAAASLGGAGAAARRRCLELAFRAWVSEEACQRSRRRQEELVQRMTDRAEDHSLRQEILLQRIASTVLACGASVLQARTLGAWWRYARCGRFQRNESWQSISRFVEQELKRLLGRAFAAWAKIRLSLQVARALDELSQSHAETQQLQGDFATASHSRDRLLLVNAGLRTRLLALTVLVRWRHLCFGSRDEWLELLWKETSTLRQRRQESGRNMAGRAWALRARQLLQYALGAWRRLLATVDGLQGNLSHVAAMAARAAVGRTDWLVQACAAWAFALWQCAFLHGRGQTELGEIHQMRLVLQYERRVRECQLEVTQLRAVLASWRREVALAAVARLPQQIQPQIFSSFGAQARPAPGAAWERAAAVAAAAAAAAPSPTVSPRVCTEPVSQWRSSPSMLTAWEPGAPMTPAFGSVDGATMHRASMQPSPQRLLVSTNNNQAQVYAVRLQQSYLAAWRRLVIVGPSPPLFRAPPSPSAASVPRLTVVPAVGPSAGMHFVDAACRRREGLLLSSRRSILPDSARAPVGPAFASARAPVGAAVAREPIAGCEPIARAASTSPRETGRAWPLSGTSSGPCLGITPTSSCSLLRGPCGSPGGRARLPCPRGCA